MLSTNVVILSVSVNVPHLNMYIESYLFPKRNGKLNMLGLQWNIL